ncbi:MAG: DUF4363 family protein [Oscillospiraceae bacterium]|nr:DUF4363 family protein [Oscillospiraceae bacterium]
MNRGIVAAASFIAAFLICLFGYMTLSDTCETLASSLTEIIDYAESEDTEAAQKKTEELLILWEEIHGRIESLTQHAETDELEEIIKSLPIYAETGNMERLKERAEIAVNRLEHIIQNEQPLFSNIF